MFFETSLLNFSFPFCHAALEMLVLPFWFFTSFSIPLLVVTSLSCLVELLFMFFWCPLTFIDDEPCRVPFRFLLWTNLPCWKLKLDWPFFNTRTNHPCVERSLVPSVCHQWKMEGLSLWRCCFGYWRCLCSCLSCINNIIHLCHPTSHRTLKRGGLVQFRRGCWKVLESGCVETHNH